MMTACSATVQSGAVQSGAGDSSDQASATTVAAAPSTTEASDPSPSTTTTPTTIVGTTTSPAKNEPEAEPQIFDPACVVEVQQFDSLGLIGNRIDDETVNIVSLRAENALPDAKITEGQLLDVCVG